MTKQQVEIVKSDFGFPVPGRPFYHVALRLKSAEDAPLRVVQARFNGASTRDIWVYNEGEPSADAVAHFGETTEVVLRVDWENGKSYPIDLVLAHDDRETEASLTVTAPAWGGYWNSAWKRYSASVVTESKGLTRTLEPVHLLLGVYADLISDPAREVRVVAIDPRSGASSEIPSQVYGISTREEVDDPDALPTTTFEVAFLADLLPNEQRVYLVFYGNDSADAPAYISDLAVSGEGLALTIENSFYRIKLHADSGQLDEILLKQGVNALFDHHVETNGALHWNPDVYAPPRIWSHASDWAPPPHAEAISGPIFFTIQRWGELPDYPDVQCSITYTFYAHQPHFVMESVTDILEDMDVRALRNGELVINLNVANEFAWQEPSGNVKTLRFDTRPQEPRRALDISADSAWWSFFNRERRAALATVILDSSAYRRSGGLARVEPYITLKWGEWAYCVRPLVYTYNSHNPKRVVRVPAGSSYSERIAFLPIRLGERDTDRFAPIVETQQRLAAPLAVRGPEMAIEPSTPEKWGVTFPYPE